MVRRRAKSSITRLPAEQREHIERLLREGRLTLDQMIAELQQTWAGEAAAEVSRSALHRYERGFAEMTGRMREIETLADAMVSELGEGSDDKASALLSQAVVTLATNVALKAHENDDTSIDEVRKLARAAKDAMDSKRVSLNVRKAIAAEAREQLLREQAEKLDSVVKSGGLSDETAEQMRKKILGIG